MQTNKYFSFCFPFLMKIIIYKHNNVLFFSSLFTKHLHFSFIQSHTIIISKVARVKKLKNMEIFLFIYESHKKD